MAIVHNTANRKLRQGRLRSALACITFAAALIESPEGIGNADEVAVDGIDVLLIGSFDLTTALGVRGQMGHS
jgi:2-keto-3-deoxy-L-rhamnonate aldolase RhmA